MTRWPIRIRLHKVSAGETYIDLETEPVPEGMLQCFQTTGFEVNEALTGTEDVRIFIAGHGYNHYVAEQNTPSADTLYWLTEDIWLVPREYLVIRVTGLGSGKTADVYILGYQQKYEEGVVT